MNSISRRILASVVGGVILLAAYAVVYQWGMAAFEGEPVSYVQALQVVLESLTTAGFGGNAPWSSTVMNAIVIGMNLTGVLLVFFTIPFFVVPLLESVFRTTAPTTTSLSEHVIVCADSSRETALRDELDAAGVPSLFVKSDADAVRDLVGDGVVEIQGATETTRTLERANVETARALVTDVDDEANANIILAARRLAPELRIVSVVEDSDTRTYHEHAGADEVVRPRVAVGEQLARKARGTRLREDLHEVTRTADGFELTEVLIEEDSDLVGHTLAGRQFRREFGVTVLGGWFHGEFVAPLPPDRELVEHAVLLVAGEPDAGQLAILGRRSGPTKPCDRVVVAGHGVVGRTVAEALLDAGVDVTVVDREPDDGVDVVGDVTEQETLRRADVDGADSVVLALSRDSLVVFSALVAGDHAPDVEMLARADDVDYVQRCYDAGVAYTLALSEVTAHMVTTRLVSPSSGEDGQHELVRTRAPALVGRSPADADVHARTGVRVVAVEREGTLHSDPDSGFVIRETDTLLLAGARADVAEFERAYGDES